MADLNFFLNKDLKAHDVAHSHGAGEVIGGGLSMEQRRKLRNKPRIVGEYHASRLGHQRAPHHSAGTRHESHSAHHATKDTDTHSNRRMGGIKDPKHIDKPSIERRHRFIEPTPRKHDKFS